MSRRHSLTARDAIARADRFYERISLSSPEDDVRTARTLIAEAITAADAQLRRSERTAYLLTSIERLQRTVEDIDYCIANGVFVRSRAREKREQIKLARVYVLADYQKAGAR